MATLDIPQALTGSLIDIADLGDLTIFPSTERCQHWGVYTANQQELACPCAGVDERLRKVFYLASEILQANFPLLIANQVLSFSQEEVAQAYEIAQAHAAGTLPRTDEEQNEEEQAEETVNEGEETAESTKEQAPKPAIPSPAAFAARFAPATSTHNEQQAEDTQSEPAPAEQSTPAPTRAAPAPAPMPGMFAKIKKSELTWRKPVYLLSPEERKESAETERIIDAPAPAALSPALPTPLTALPGVATRAQSDSLIIAEPETDDAPVRYIVRPELRRIMADIEMSHEKLVEVIEEGEREELTPWLSLYRHDDYLVEVNTVSHEVILIVDEYEDEEEL